MTCMFRGSSSKVIQEMTHFPGETFKPSVSSTVTEITLMFQGCSSEVIQEVTSTAVKYFNVNEPTAAAIPAPVETDPSGDFALFYRWMSTVKPASGMGTTSMSSNTCRRHFCPRVSLETIPSIQWIITKKRRWTVGHFPVTAGQSLVVEAIWRSKALDYFLLYHRVWTQHPVIAIPGQA